MISLVADINESQANLLCKSCGLCCTGYLFIWAKLRPSELDPAESLGLNVFRSNPAERGFSQPCPLWQRQCMVYDSSHYPHVCRSYKCKLLKEVIAENTSLPNALTVIEQAKEMICEVESLLPDSAATNFRQRLVTELEESNRLAQADARFRSKAEALLGFYETVFGVDDLVEKADVILE
ncbi:MAG: hypothetical protein HKUEN02_22410 [Anaerolineaceae bacterium]|nr:MAG: hypothetical protein HKUEN02_22410 [Anaerolineaceae bacterium]